MLFFRDCDSPVLGPLLTKLDWLDKANVMELIKGRLESFFQLAGIIRAAKTEFFTSKGFQIEFPGWRMKKPFV